MLNKQEHEAMALTVELTNKVAQEIIGDGSTRSQDINEFCMAIHVIQNMILAQSAGREHPDKYRLMGQTVQVDW